MRSNQRERRISYANRNKGSAEKNPRRIKGPEAHQVPALRGVTDGLGQERQSGFVLYTGAQAHYGEMGEN